MASPIEIREAGKADREVLLRFHRDLYQSHRDEVVGDTVRPLIAYRDYDRVLEADVDALLEDRACQVLLATHHGNEVGYISGRAQIESERVLTRRATVEDWYVQAGHRGTGIGRALLSALESRFQAMGCEVLESGTWASNRVARTAHDALGFEEVRIVFRKRLGQ
ncbi:MAG: GNAT family N-acetyltransferase [Polyangiales bacterium]